MKDSRKHILDNKTTDETGHKTSFCGENISMLFHFKDVEHAVINRQNRAYLLPCIQCKNAVIKELNNKD